MNEIALVFKALCDPIRLRIMRLVLRAEKEVCACEICDSLMEPQYAISRNIKILKFAGMLQERKDGKWVYYRPNKRAERFYKLLFEALKQIPGSEKMLQKDMWRFKRRMGLRERGKCLLGIQNAELLS